MSIRDTAAQNTALDALLGASKAAGVPATFDLALFDGDPGDGGTELDGTGGYARVAVANDGATWPAAANGIKTTASPVTLAGTDTYETAATHWLLLSGSTGWFTGELDAEVTEPTDTVTLSVFFGDE